MTPKEPDILERIRARWKKPEDKTVAKDIVRKDDAPTDLTTADLAQAGENDVREEPLEKTSTRRESAAMPPSSAPDAAPKGSGQSGAASGSTGAAVARARKDEEAAGPLFSGDEANNLRSQWESVQVGFVDEPRRAVEQADHLVAETIHRLAQIFADERQRLERQWDRGENVSTEDLRLGLRRYRAFFERLLSV
jgi:hypothetical protein